MAGLTAQRRRPSFERSQEIDPRENVGVASVCVDLGGDSPADTLWIDPGSGTGKLCQPSLSENVRQSLACRARHLRNPTDVRSHVCSASSEKKGENDVGHCPDPCTQNGAAHPTAKARSWRGR
jgi:hypothetical protein